MNLYIFKGVVLPERAQLSMSGVPKVTLTHVGTGRTLDVEVSVVLNQITAWVECVDDWELLDLRNIVHAHVTDLCSYMALAKGLAYGIDMRQVLNRDKGIDYVFGIEVQCVAQRHDEPTAKALFDEAVQKSQGEQGIYLHRCFNDLRTALRESEDTAFHCYRAIESLRQLCGLKYGIQREADQWGKLGTLTGYDQAYIAFLRGWAGSERHGGAQYYTDAERADILNRTWNVVEKVLHAI